MMLSTMAKLQTMPSKTLWQVFMEDDSKKLDEILAILKRVEERQIKTTAMVSEVKEHEAPIVGSFASSELGDKHGG